MTLRWEDKPCPGCQATDVYFWIKDIVWRQAGGSAALGSSCVECTQKALGRPLTLNDLAIDKYQESVKSTRNHRFVVQESVRATLIGACNAAGVSIPDGWTVPSSPHIASLQSTVGERLAKQTKDANSAVERLIEEANAQFPVAISDEDLRWARESTAQWAQGPANIPPKIVNQLNRNLRKGGAARAQALKDIRTNAKNNAPICHTAAGRDERVLGAVVLGLVDAIEVLSKQ